MCFKCLNQKLCDFNKFWIPLLFFAPLIFIQLFFKIFTNCINCDTWLYYISLGVFGLFFSIGLIGIVYGSVRYIYFRNVAHLPEDEILLEGYEN